MSSRSTRTTTTWRVSTGASAASEAPSSSCTSSTMYWRWSRISPKYMSGPTMTTTQAPSVNLTVAKMSTIRAVRKAEMALTTTPRRHFGPLVVEVVLDHARTRPWRTR